MRGAAFPLITDDQIESVLECAPIIIEAGSEVARRTLRIVLARAYAQLCERGPGHAEQRQRVADALLAAHRASPQVAPQSKKPPTAANGRSGGQ